MMNLFEVGKKGMEKKLQNVAGSIFHSEIRKKIICVILIPREKYSKDQGAEDKSDLMNLRS